MNNVTLMGRLVRDPELRMGQGEKGTAVCSYRIAVARDFKRDGEPDSDFFNVVAFGARGEFVSKYFHKGDMIALVGRLQNREYTTKAGEKRNETQIIASANHFCGSKASQNQYYTQAAPATPDFTVEDTDDDIPF